MRTFKLEQRYYGSPKVGTVIREDSLGQLVSENLDIFKTEEIIECKQWVEFDELDHSGCEYGIGSGLIDTKSVIVNIIEKNIDTYLVEFAAYGEKIHSLKMKISQVNFLIEKSYWVKKPIYICGIDVSSSEHDYFKFNNVVLEDITKKMYPTYRLILHRVTERANRFQGSTYPSHLIKNLPVKYSDCEIFEVMRISDGKFIKLGDFNYLYGSVLNFVEDCCNLWVVCELGIINIESWI